MDESWLWYRISLWIWDYSLCILLLTLQRLIKMWNLRWPRELNALQLQKTYANRKSTSKSRKHFHHFDSRWCKCSQHKQINLICSAFLFWLCCEHLQHMHCQIDESVFLICRCSFLFVASYFFWLCCEYLQRVCCKIEEVVSLICRCFFYLKHVELSRPP